MTSVSCDRDKGADRAPHTIMAAAAASAATGPHSSASSVANSAAPPAYDTCFVPKQPKTTYKDLDKQISIDLLVASQREANFLRMIDRKAPVLYEEDVVRNAIRRYEQFWLPLQVRTQSHDFFDPFLCL